MLESGFAKGGKSQGMMDTSKLTDSWKWCTCSRRLFFLLLLGAVLFFYNTNIEALTPDWNPKWWLKHKAAKWFPFKSHSQNVVFPDVMESRPGNITYTNVTEMNITIPQAINVAEVTAQVTQKNTVLPTAVPYVSPGPYLVEYPYEYHFIINEPKKCEEQKPYLVLMVPVAPNNRAHRDIIRRTWGGEGLVRDKVVKLFFLLGQPTGEGAEQLPEQLLQESKEHQDLIQSDFMDCYKNLTIKTMVMLEWLGSYCSSASYAMKIDSDMFLNVPKLIDMLSHAPKTNYMTGLVANGAAVLRDPKSKWYLPVDLYPHPQYPRYALGLGYVLSLDLPKKLVEASRHVKALYIEDVYLGLCMQHLNIAPTDPPSWNYFNVFPVQYSRCAYSRIIATTTNEHADRVWTWKDFSRPGSYC